LLHAVSWAYFFNAALNGMFFHGLLLSTGNILLFVRGVAFSFLRGICFGVLVCSNKAFDDSAFPQ